MLVAISILILHIGETKVWISGWGILIFLIIAGAAAK